MRSFTVLLRQCGPPLLLSLDLTRHMVELCDHCCQFLLSIEIFALGGLNLLLYLSEFYFLRQISLP